MFMLQYQPQIHRVIALFAFVCVVFDIIGLVKRSSVTEYEELPNGTLAVIFGIVLDIMLLGYFFTTKHDFKFPAGGDRTPRDWNKHPKMASSYPTILTLVCKTVVLALTLSWPIYEIVMTSQITQPLHPTFSSGTGDYDSGFTRISPLISDFTTYLHLQRARNAIALSISVLVAIDIRISFGRWNLGRKTLPRQFL